MIKRHNETIYLETSKYAVDNTLAVVMICENGTAFGTLTVNIQEDLRDNCAFVDYNNMGEDIVDWIQENNLGTYTGRIGFSGFCAYPEVKFDLEEIKKHAYK